MLNSKSFAAPLLSVYLRFCILVGLHGHVYRLVTKWAAAGRMWYYGEKYTQLHLLDLGCHRCPSCLLATEKPNEHLQDRTSWCFEQTLSQCPDCYALLEEGVECANCKINQQIDEQQREMLKQEHRREMEWEREILAAEQDLAEERQEALNDECRGVRSFYEEANCPDEPDEL